MDTKEFTELTKKLRLTETSKGRRMQGRAVDIANFLAASGQTEIKDMFIGVHVSMMASGTHKLEISFEDDSLGDRMVDGAQVKLEVSPEGVTLERLPSESPRGSTPSANDETLSDGGGS